MVYPAIVVEFLFYVHCKFSRIPSCFLFWLFCTIFFLFRMRLLVSLFIHGGRDLEEDNLEGTLFSRRVNKFDWMQDHISFTYEFASSTGYLFKNVW